MEKDRFVTKNIMTSAYLAAKGNPIDELIEENGKIVFTFNRSDKIYEDYQAFKEDEFINKYINAYHQLKRDMFAFKNSQK